MSKFHIVLAIENRLNPVPFSPVPLYTNINADITQLKLLPQILLEPKEIGQTQRYWMFEAFHDNTLKKSPKKSLKLLRVINSYYSSLVAYTIKVLSLYTFRHQLQ